MQPILTEQVMATLWHWPADHQIVDWKTTQNHGTTNADTDRVRVERHSHCEEADGGEGDWNKEGNLKKKGQMSSVIAGHFKSKYNISLHTGIFMNNSNLKSRKGEKVVNLASLVFWYS